MNAWVETSLVLLTQAFPIQTLINLLWKSSLVLAFAGLASFMLRNSSAGIRHWVWNVAFAALLLFPIAGLTLPDWRLEVLPTAIADKMGSQKSPRQTSNVEHAPEWPAETALTKQNSSLTPPLIGAEQKQVAGTKLRTGWQLYATLLWLAGMLYILSRLAVELLGLALIFRKARVLSANEWSTTMNYCLNRLDISRKVELRSTPHISVPITYGLLRPKILIPYASDTWTLSQKYVVAMHELSHVKRLDYLGNLIAHMASGVYWFNPLVWAAVRQFRRERERACDDRVLNSGTDSHVYANELLKIAQGLSSRDDIGHRVLAMARQADLKQRLHYVLSRQVKRHEMPGGAALISCVAALLLLAPLAMMQLHSRQAPDMQTAASATQPAWAGNADNEQEANRQRRQELWAMGENKDKSAVSLLVGALKDSDPEIRYSAAWALGQIKDRRALAPLLKQLHSQDADTREKIVLAIGELKDRRASADLADLLRSDSDPKVRMAATWALGEICVNHSLSHIIKALNDGHAEVRQAAVHVLRKSCRPEAIAALVERLRLDSNKAVRENAAWVLGEIGHPLAVPGLISKLQDECSSVRVRVVEALGKLGDPRSTESLAPLLRDSNPGVRAKVIWALDKIKLPNT